MNEQYKNSLVISYAHGTLKNKDLSLAEKMIEEEKQAQFYVRKIQSERAMVRDLIPQKEISLSQSSSLLRELSDITSRTLPSSRKDMVKKFKDFLDKPIITINY